MLGGALQRGLCGKQLTTASSQQGTEAPGPTALKVSPASNDVCKAQAPALARWSLQMRLQPRPEDTVKPRSDS